MLCISDFLREALVCKRTISPETIDGTHQGMEQTESYVANFKVRLRTPVRSADRTFPELRVVPKDGLLTAVAINITPDANGLISNVAVRCVYAGEGLTIVRYPGSDAVDLFASGEGGGLLSPPFEASRIALAPVLYWLGALTLQASVFYRVEDYLTSSIQDFNWTLPDGRTLSSGQQLFPSYPGRAVRELTEAGTRPLMLDDWSALQEIANGGSAPVELWQLVFADALRERANDIRVTVVHCATALDVAAQAILPSEVKFNMDILRGGGTSGVIVTPDMSRVDPKLYDDLSQLWYTRHGIVHRGEIKLYIENPIHAAAKSRALTAQDVERFLIALPKGVQFLQKTSLVLKPKKATVRKVRIGKKHR